SEKTWKVERQGYVTLPFSHNTPGMRNESSCGSYLCTFDGRGMGRTVGNAFYVDKRCRPEYNLFAFLHTGFLRDLSWPGERKKRRRP
ncbi:MAG: hypothetical protein KBG12_09215, partial [Syntrophobacterales bacterium]|nr:hypothetical protein [Syntrophobacterales bacterium]